MTRSLEDIGRLFAYNRWANARTFEAVSALSEKELARPSGGSFGSVRDTLVHLVGAEWVWLERWQGRSPRALPGSDELSTLDALRSRLNEVEAGRERFFAAVTPERLAAEIAYVNFKGEHFAYPLGEALVHLVNHGTYHRGQITTLLRQLGKKPLATDYLLFLEGQKRRQAS